MFFDLLKISIVMLTILNSRRYFGTDILCLSKILSQDDENKTKK